MATLRSPTIIHGALLCVALMLLLAACGGGDDGGGTTPPPAPAVTAPTALTYTTPANLTVNAAATCDVAHRHRHGDHVQREPRAPRGPVAQHHDRG